MTISPGARFGRYDISALIGVGGMGEVYRAHDATLDREVAIKVLPESVAGDAERIARFAREAKALAALNHSNIAHVYGLDEADGVHALVMELVEGPTLADRIAEGPLPADEALRIAGQIASALEVAHERGIVHRDLKPANVKLKPDGTAKLLDFGIAKALDIPLTTPQGSILTTPALTQAGVVLGTAAYMSPEQARGRAVDERTDIWAFGCVLYEMLCGRAAFAGEDVTSTLARVLERAPDLGALPTAIAPSVRRTIELCLQKDLRKRVADVRDVKLALDGEFETERAALPEARSQLLRTLGYAVALLVGGVIAALVAWSTKTPPEARPVVRFSVPLPAAGAPGVIIISRDGSRIAFKLGGLTGPMFVRDLDSLEAQVLAIPDATTPCFSPDGDWFAYASPADTQLRRVSLAGGTPLALADVEQGGGGTCDWAEDGYIYYATVRTGVVRVPEAGGQPQLVGRLDVAGGEIGDSFPQLLPTGAHLFVNTATSAGGFVRLRAAVYDLATQRKTTLLETPAGAHYVPSGPGAARGHLLYGQDGTLFAMPVDLGSLTVGPPVPVLSGVAMSGATVFAALSDTGTLAYFTSTSALLGHTFAWVDRSGRAADLPEPTHSIGHMALSPDGRRLAVSQFDALTFTADIWLYDIESRRFTRLTFDSFSDAPIWTPDGAQVVYKYRTNALASDAELRAVPADGSGPPVTLASLPAGGPGSRPTSISFDRRVMLGESYPQGALSGDVWVLPLDAAASGGADPGSTPRPLLATEFSERDPQFSPDGRYIAYSSDESGRAEVYVVPYPGPGAKSPVSIGGGTTPRWNPNGREVFYESAGRLMAVDVEMAPAFRALAPRVLFEAPGLLPMLPANVISYDVARDGSRFMMTKQPAQDGAGAVELHVVLNWFEELRRLSPAR